MPLSFQPALNVQELLAAGREGAEAVVDTLAKSYQLKFCDESAKPGFAWFKPAIIRSHRT